MTVQEERTEGTTEWRGTGGEKTEGCHERDTVTIKVEGG